MNKETVSKTIRFPQALYKRLEEAAEKKNGNFSATVIDMLEHGTVVVIPEGREIAALLFEISLQLRKGHDTDRAMIEEATGKLVNAIAEIHERCFKEGEIDGDR